MLNYQRVPFIFTIWWSRKTQPVNLDPQEPGRVDGGVSISINWTFYVVVYPQLVHSMKYKY